MGTSLAQVEPKAALKMGIAYIGKKRIPGGGLLEVELQVIFILSAFLKFS